MHKLISVSISDNTLDDKCANCEMKKGSNESCCKDHHILVKTGDSQIKEATSLPDFLNWSLIVPVQQITFDPILPSQELQSPLSNGPPLIGSQPIYILNSVYLI